MKYLIVLLLMTASVSEAKTKAPSEATLKTIYTVAKEFNIDAQLLIKIAAIESSFREHARRVNTNNTVDIGLFQINSVHWTTTCKEYNVFSVKGNTQCAAKLVKGISKFSSTDPHWEGRYHSKTPSKKKGYAKLLSQIDISQYE